MQLLKIYKESDVNPSPAARALLDSLKLPVGAAVVWPTTRAGKLTLVVQLNQNYWARATGIPSCFEGYAVIVERGAPLSGGSMASLGQRQFH